MVDVSHSTLTKADNPAGVIEIPSSSLSRKCKRLSNLLPTKPRDKISAPSSPILSEDETFQTAAFRWQ